MATFWINEKLRLPVKIRFKSVMRDEYKRREMYSVLFYFVNYAFGLWRKEYIELFSFLLDGRFSKQNDACYVLWSYVM